MGRCFACRCSGSSVSGFGFGVGFRGSGCGFCISGSGVGTLGPLAWHWSHWSSRVVNGAKQSSISTKHGRSYVGARFWTRVPGFEIRVTGFGLRNSGFEIRVPGFGFQVVLTAHTLPRTATRSQAPPCAPSVDGQRSSVDGQSFGQATPLAAGTPAPPAAARRISVLIAVLVFRPPYWCFDRRMILLAAVLLMWLATV